LLLHPRPAFASRYPVELRYDPEFWPGQDTAADALASAESVRTVVVVGISPATRKVGAWEKKYDQQLKVGFDAIRELTKPAALSKRKIGFLRAVK
jgi:hypothetical protein